MKHLFLIIFLFGCASSFQNDRLNDGQTIRFKSFMREGEKEEKVIYTLSVPKGGDKIYVEGSHEKEIQLKYPDSSYIYITNNSESASYLNYDNISRLGQEIYSKKLLKDTLLLEGTQPNGNFWKENKLGDIVIGYHNVPESKKALYDKSLESLTMR